MNRSKPSSAPTEASELGRSRPAASSHRRRTAPDRLDARITSIRLGTPRYEIEAVEGLYVSVQLHRHSLRGDAWYTDRDLPSVEAALRDPARCDDTIVELLTRVGPDALAPTMPLLDVLKDAEGVRQRIRDLVHSRIRQCYAAARWARNDGDRPAAQLFFERVGKALAGPQQGRRNAAVRDRSAVVEFYYRMLFRLRVARQLMKEPADLSREKKLHAVAATCRLSNRRVREHFLRSTGEPKRPITIKAQARLWTGMHFRIKQQAVANMLILPQRRQSSKAP